MVNVAFLSKMMSYYYGICSLTGLDTCMPDLEVHRRPPAAGLEALRQANNVVWRCGAGGVEVSPGFEGLFTEDGSSVLR